MKGNIYCNLEVFFILEGFYEEVRFELKMGFLVKFEMMKREGKL